MEKSHQSKHQNHEIKAEISDKSAYNSCKKQINGTFGAKLYRDNEKLGLHKSNLLHKLIVCLWKVEKTMNYADYADR